MDKHARPTKEADFTDLQALYRRPDFLLRRAHQISVSLFMEELAAKGVTTTQYSLMYILRARPGLDQIGLAKLIGLDRSTTGLVVGKLEDAGLVVRTGATDDRRRKVLNLTAQGKALMRRLAIPAERAQAKLLAPLKAQERKLFLGLLEKLVDAYNGEIRTPLLPE